MASAVGDCLPSTGGAGKRLTLIVRIPGSGKADENRASILRISRTPTLRRTILSLRAKRSNPDGCRGQWLASPRALLATTVSASFCRAGALGESLCQGRSGGGEHAALSDQPGDQPRRR